MYVHDTSIDQLIVYSTLSATVPSPEDGARALRICSVVNKSYFCFKVSGLGGESRPPPPELPPLSTEASNGSSAVAMAPWICCCVSWSEDGGSEREPPPPPPAELSVVLLVVESEITWWPFNPMCSGIALGIGIESQCSSCSSRPLLTRAVDSIGVSRGT